MSSTRSIPINAIRPRASADTRALDPLHVLGLAESIGALGLIEPVAIDQSNHLLAGAHRWAACRLVALANVKQRQALFKKLFEGMPESKRADLADRLAAIDRTGWLSRHPDNRVPVRVMAIDNKATDAALAIEVAENEKRRDYTPHEIQALAVRLRKAGYIESEGGRPKVGIKLLRPMIASVIGKSERQVRRLLKGRASDSRPSGQVRGRGKGTRPHGQVTSWETAVRRLARVVKACRVLGKRKAEAGKLMPLLVKVERVLAVA